LGKRSGNEVKMAKLGSFSVFSGEKQRGGPLVPGMGNETGASSPGNFYQCGKGGRANFARVMSTKIPGGVLKEGISFKV